MLQGFMRTTDRPCSTYQTVRWWGVNHRPRPSRHIQMQLAAHIGEEDTWSWVHDTGQAPEAILQFIHVSLFGEARSRTKTKNTFANKNFRSCFVPPTSRSRITGVTICHCGRLDQTKKKQMTPAAASSFHYSTQHVPVLCLHIGRWSDLLCVN